MEQARGGCRIDFNGGSGALKDTWDAHSVGPNLPNPGTRVTNYRVSDRAQEQPVRVAVRSGSLMSSSWGKQKGQCDV